MCLCPCISFAHALFLKLWNAWSFHDVLQYGKVNFIIIPITTFYEAQSCQEIAPSQTIPKTIQKRYTKRYFRFRFARHPPLRTSMTSLLLSLLALACAGGQLCRCLCWRCWWCLCCSGAWCRCWGVSVWCLVLLVWCLVSLGVVLVVVPLPLLLLLGAGAAAAAVGAAAGGSGGGGGGGAAAAAGGNVLVQAEVGRNHADVEFAIWGGVSDKKRPACK